LKEQTIFRQPAFCLANAPTAPCQCVRGFVMTALTVCDFAGRKLQWFSRLDFEHSGKFANDL
jgi:hypothetical protein